MHLLTAVGETTEDDFDAILHEDAGECTVVLICFIMYCNHAYIPVPLTFLLVDAGPNLKMFVPGIMCIAPSGDLLVKHSQEHTALHVTSAITAL